MVPPATLVCCWDLLPSPQQLPPPSCSPDALHLQISEREDNSIREKFESRQVASFYECSKPAKSDFRTKHLSKCIVYTRDGKKKKTGLEASRGRANVLGIRSTIMIFMCRAKYIWKKCQGLKLKRKKCKQKEYLHKCSLAWAAKGRSQSLGAPDGRATSAEEGTDNADSGDGW